MYIAQAEINAHNFDGPELSLSTEKMAFGQVHVRRRLLDLLVTGSFPDQFYRVGREVIKNKVDFFFFFFNTRKSKLANSWEVKK